MFSLRTQVHPCHLYLWLWPITLLTATTLLRRRELYTCLLAASAGWALHLALDGILLLI